MTALKEEYRGIKSKNKKMLHLNKIILLSWYEEFFFADCWEKKPDFINHFLSNAIYVCQHYPYFPASIKDPFYSSAFLHHSLFNLTLQTLTVSLNVYSVYICVPHPFKSFLTYLGIFPLFWLRVYVPLTVSLNVCSVYMCHTPIYFSILIYKLS